MRVILIAVGILSFETEYIDYDYKKYLGPEWKDDKNKIGTVVIGNHQSWLDTIVNM